MLAAAHTDHRMILSLPAQREGREKHRTYQNKSAEAPTCLWYVRFKASVEL